MFSYAIDPDRMLLVIERHLARPVYELPSSAMRDEMTALAGALSELSASLSRSLGTFHRPPTTARMAERWAERRQESLDIVGSALREPLGSGMARSDPRYRTMREAAHSVRSALRAIGEPKLIDVIAAVLEVEIGDLESRENIAIFGVSRHSRPRS